MRIKNLHRWDISPKKAVKLQRALAQLVIREDHVRKVKKIAGVDVSCMPDDDTLYAGAVVIDMEKWCIVEAAYDIQKTSFPYIPGLLSFREAPAILGALRKLKATPDVVIVDGQGLAHPRRFGLASHLGVVLDRPTIGCGKSRLVGTYEEPGKKSGAMSNLMDGNEIIGKVLRTRDGVKCVYVSVGHQVTLSAAERLVLACCTRYRLPEPTRLADQLVGRAKNNVRS